MTPDAIAATEFTPTERRIVLLLSDGFGHGRGELMALLDDDLASVHAARIHLTRIRKKLPRQFGIISEFRGNQYFYRMVRFVGGAGE